MATTEEIISHYQRDIEKITSHPERVEKYQDRLLHCLNKLRKLPVTVNHLHATGVGKTVNSLRKIQVRKDVGVAAKALVAKWKNMVIEEDNDEKEKEKSNKRFKKEENDEEKSYAPSNSSVTPRAEYSPSKKSHAPDEYEPSSASTSNGIKVMCYYSPSKKDDTKKTDQDNKKRRSSDCEKTSHDVKKQRSKSKSSSSKNNDNGINFSSGASFEEALGGMPIKKSSSSTSKSNHSKSSPSKVKIASDVPVKQLLDDVAGPSHLVPLDLDVVSTLSVPTTHYRPMPQPIVSYAERKHRSQMEEDALASIWSNKNKTARTKVYSGVKGINSHVLSLYDICCNVLKQHIDALEYTGGIPFTLLRPILEGASPNQLYNFENFNPYVIGETDDLWKFHCQKDFRSEKREEMETWRDMYLRCLDEREEKYKAVTANIQESLKKTVPVRKTKLAYVEVLKTPKSQRNSRMNAAKPTNERLMGKGQPGVVEVRPSSLERPRVNPIFKPKVAPLMQKTLKSIRQTRFKR